MTTRFVVGAWNLEVARRCCRLMRLALATGIGVAGVALVSITGSAQAQNANRSADQSAAPDITRQVQTEVSVPLPTLSPIVDRVVSAVVNVSVVMGEQEFSQDEG